MKVSGSTASLLQGVSQQTPQDRTTGQHTEQINMLPDPVQGLSRRHGTKFVAESATSLDPSTFAAMVADTANWQSFNYSNAGHDYVVLYRTAAATSGSALPVLQVYDITTQTFLPLVRNGTDAQLDLLISGGVSGIANIGKYVFLSGFSTLNTADTFDAWGDAGNKNNTVLWVRGGTYSRTYSATATRSDGTQFTFSYTTPTSSYPGTLDTSGVPIYAADPAGGTQSDTEAAYITDDGAGHGICTLGWAAWSPTGMTVTKGGTTYANSYPSAPGVNQYEWAPGGSTMLFNSADIGAVNITLEYTHLKTVTNPNYSKIVGDLSNDFNTKVTNWIGSASDAIAPEAIAAQLLAAATAAGLTGGTVQASTVIFTNVSSISATDGGDGTLIRAVANEVDSIEEVTTIHKIGKIVKVRAENSAQSFYLTAISKSDGITSGFTEVTWIEGGGIKYTITNALLYLTVSAGTAYIGSSAAIMNGLVPGLNAPVYPASTVGDADSSPLPYFINRQITYLGVFQDRLVIGCGAVVRFSRINDFLNFFRTSVLSIFEDDSLEMLSQGSDDDTLRYSVIYDRDLVIFGLKRQYAISGRSALTPTSANMQVMAAIPNAAQVPPLAVSSFVFYGQQGDTAGSVYQIQPGQITDSPESYIMSAQIDTYMGGQIIELADWPKPNHILVRTSGDRNSLYVFSYLDRTQYQGGRVQNAWHKLSFNPALGAIIGMSRTPQGMLVFYLREQTNHAGVNHVYYVADLLPFTTGLAIYPYLDSIRPLSVVNTNTGGVNALTTGDWQVAFDSTSEWRFVGTNLSDQVSLLAEFPDATGPQVGILQDSLFTPTNPFIRDKNDKVITNGRLTVTSVQCTIQDSSGFWTDVTSKGRETTTTVEYNARIVGSPDDLVGRETITDVTYSTPIALETNDYTLTYRGRTWLPFTITSLEWVGQWFNRTQRF
jgi:hypothetical protein